MKKYFIIMGDVVNSRKKDQQQLWNDLNFIISDANDKLSNLRASKLDIKLGDDFQVLSTTIEEALEILYFLDITFDYFNIECRFALGYGEVEGKVSKDSIYNLMGEALTSTHTILSNKTLKTKYRFYIQNNDKIQLSLDTIGLLLEEITLKQTQKRKEFLYYFINQKLDNEQLMKKLDIKQRNIYKYKEDTKYNLLQEVFKNITQLLKDI
jgi:hypothetical protein